MIYLGLWQAIARLRVVQTRVLVAHDNVGNINCLTTPVTDVMAALARRYRIPGLQFACQYDGATASWQAGELEIGTGLRVTSDTAFPVGSITKCFTATLAMILAADGDIALDSPIGDYLPELGELGDVVTLHHLLSHTSGLAASAEADEAAAASLRRYAEEHILREDLVMPPGTGFSYSNAGYCLVGLLIEAITGMPWAEAIEAILLRPLDIEPAFTATSIPGPFARPIAVGHSVNAAVGRTRPVQSSRPFYEIPVGALAVSALDLVKLASLHIGAGLGHLLPAAYAQQMRRAVPGAVPFGLADGWGLGLAVYRSADTYWVGHDGNAEGTACYLRINPADGWIIALTTNASNGGGLWRDLLAELENAGVPIAGSSAPPTPPPVAPPPDCVGKYVNGTLEYRVVADDNGSVYLTVDGVPPERLTFHADTAFSMVDPTLGRRVIGGRFVPDPITGSIQGMQIGGRFTRRLRVAASV
jgi:CubicO group peptidase (beta-lactamase class C family)